MQTIGFTDAGNGSHHHIAVEHLPKDDIYRLGEYAFNRGQAEVLLSRWLTLLYGEKHGR